MYEKISEIKEKIYQRIDKEFDDKNISLKKLKDIVSILSSTSMIQETNFGKIFDILTKNIDNLEKRNEKCLKKLK